MHLPDISAQLRLVRRDIKVRLANMVHPDNMAHRWGFSVGLPPVHQEAHRLE